MGEKVDRDRIIMDGTVLESCKGIFKVKLDSGSEVQCTLSGKIREFSIKIVAGDPVKVELSQHDLTKGRIIVRKNERTR